MCGCQSNPLPPRGHSVEEVVNTRNVHLGETTGGEYLLLRFCKLGMVHCFVKPETSTISGIQKKSTLFCAVHTYCSGKAKQVIFLGYRESLSCGGMQGRMCFLCGGKIITWEEPKQVMWEESR
jgi:hypothetical protein